MSIRQSALMAVVATAAAFISNPVYKAYAGYPPCFRQPVLLVTPGGILAFAEGRNNTSGGNICSGTYDGINKYIVLRRSLDNGATWQPMQTLYTSSGIDYLAALYDPATGVSHLFVQLGSSTLYWTSSDYGASWTAGNIQFKLPSFFTSAYPAVANGIAIDGQFCSEASCGGTTGRLVVPYVCHGSPKAAAAHLRARREAASAYSGDIACAGCYSCTLISDDHGVSWQLGGYTLQEGSREASIVQANTTVWGAAQAAAGGAASSASDSDSSSTGGAVIYATERSMGNATGHKLFAVSFDGASSFTRFGSSSVPDGDTANWTGIVSGISRFDTPISTSAPSPLARRIVQAVPNSLTARTDLALFVSSDEGQTWSTGRIVQPGPTGYTAAWQFNSTHLAVLFENGANEFAQQISLGFATVDDLPATAA